MSRLFIGQTETGKTTKMKEVAKGIHNKTIVLDFNNQYSDWDGHEITIDTVNPLLGRLNLSDTKALNAGYLDHSHSLYRMCRDILKEDPLYRTSHESEKDMILNSLSKEGLVEEAIERLLVSWEPNENERGRELNDGVSMNQNKKHLSLDDVFTTFLENDVVIFKMKNIHSSKMRAATFAILNRVSTLYSGKVTVIADNLTTLFNQGNIKLFLSTVNLENLEFLLAFNKVSNVPKPFFDLINEYYVFRFENNTDIKALIKYMFNDEPNLESKVSHFKRKVKQLQDHQCYEKSLVKQNKIAIA